MSNIFIHVPKTGGTSLIMAALNCQRPPNVGFYYRHFSISNPKSNCADIFEENNIQKYASHNIILFLRNPLDRLESEYWFLKNRTEWRAHWPGPTYPETLLEYIQHPATHNSILKFLLGHPLFSTTTILPSDLERVCNTFKSLNFIFGLTEKFDDSIKNLSAHTNITLPKNNIRHRTNLNKPTSPNMTAIAEQFKNFNTLDMKLFETVNNIFHQQLAITGVASIDNTHYEFQGGPYPHLIIYTNRPANRSPLSIYYPESNFIKEHKQLLNNINDQARKSIHKHSPELTHDMKKYGKAFAVEWLKLICHHFDLKIEISQSKPLESIRSVANKLC